MIVLVNILDDIGSFQNVVRKICCSCTFGDLFYALRARVLQLEIVFTMHPLFAGDVIHKIGVPGPKSYGPRCRGLQ